jgi:uncharacterized protein (TIGR03546 family)
MLARILRPLTSLMMAILAEESSAVLAGSITFGMMLGFVPKDNLLAPLLGIFMLLLRLNLTVTTASAATFSGIAAMLDSVADAVGRAVLTIPSLSPLWTALYELPIVPWTRFNNTVVMGSLLIAAALALPLHLTIRYLLMRYRPAVKQWIKEQGIDVWLGMVERTPVGSSA